MVSYDKLKIYFPLKNRKGLTKVLQSDL